MKYPIAFPAAEKEFTLRLQKMTTDAVNDVDLDLADLWFDDDLKQSDLPKALPVKVRQRLMRLEKEKRQIETEMNDIVSVFEDITGAILKQKQAEDDKNKPHCEKCGQILKSKPKSKRRT